MIFLNFINRHTLAPCWSLSTHLNRCLTSQRKKLTCIRERWVVVTLSFRYLHYQSTMLVISVGTPIPSFKLPPFPPVNVDFRTYTPPKISPTTLNGVKRGSCSVMTPAFCWSFVKCSGQLNVSGIADHLEVTRVSWHRFVAKTSLCAKINWTWSDWICLSCFSLSGIVWEPSTYLCLDWQHVPKHVNWPRKSVCYYQVQDCVKIHFFAVKSSMNFLLSITNVRGSHRVVKKHR